MASANPWTPLWLHYGLAVRALVETGGKDVDILQEPSTSLANAVGGENGHRLALALTTYNDATATLVRDFLGGAHAQLAADQQRWALAGNDVSSILATVVCARSLTRTRAEVQRVSTSDGVYREWIEPLQVATLDLAVARGNNGEWLACEHTLVNHCLSIVAEQMALVCKPMSEQARQMLAMKRRGG